MSQRPLFPAASRPEEFERVRRDDAALRPGIEEICARVGLKGLPVERFPDGSLPVLGVGDSLVLKLYPPYDLDERDREALVLRAIDGKLPVPTPAVRETGELEGWGYVLMTRLRGELLSAAWPRIPEAARIRLAGDLGAALGALHAVGDPGLAGTRESWEAFLAEQRRTCVERQRARGLEKDWLDQIPGFLEATPLDRKVPAPSGGEGGEPLVLLHTEIMREHLFVERTEKDGFRLSGLFDFEPAMMGAAEYELASVGVFFSSGDPALFRAVLAGLQVDLSRAGSPIRTDDPSPDLSRRALAYALLHRYSNLSWYLERVPPPPGTRTLEALASSWWGTRSR